MGLLTPLYVAIDATRILTTLLYNATFGIITKPRRLSYKQNLVFRTIQVVRRCTIIGQKIDPDGTHTTYREFVKKHALPYRVTSLDVHSAQLLWLGSADADYVVYWLHGGAYTHPAVAGHFTNMQRLIDAAARSGHTLQVAALKYDLAPNQQHPQQLREACAGLHHLVSVLGYSSDRICMIGDSAGGHMALSVASHILHPHPDVEPLKLHPDSSPLAALILISPWVNFKNNSTSWKTNAQTDYLLATYLANSASKFLGASKTDNYTQPVDAPAEWWRELPARLVGVTYGKLEVFADDVIRLGETLKNAQLQSTELLAFEGEAHDQIVVNSTLGWEPSSSEEVITRWVLSALQHK